MEESIYNILVSFLIAIINGIIPVIITMSLKKINGQGWEIEVSENAKKMKRQIMFVGIKGELICLISLRIYYFTNGFNDTQIRFIIFYIIGIILFNIRFIKIKNKKFKIIPFVKVIMIQLLFLVPMLIFWKEIDIYFDSMIYAMISIISASVMYDELRVIRMNNKLKSVIQRICCFLFTFSLTFFFGEVMLKKGGNFIEVSEMFLFMIPLVGYFVYEMSYYDQIYKYSKVNIYLKNQKTINGIDVEDIYKREDWFFVQIKDKHKSIRIHKDNIEYFEYYGVV